MGDPRGPGVRRKLLASAALLVVVGLGTFASFSATTQNQGDRITSGTVSIQDNDAGAALLSLSGARPGDTDSGCIKVTYTGTLASTVRLYGTTTGTGLDPYLDLKVTRGAYTPSEPAFRSCTNFAADSTNYIGQGAGVIYNGTLQDYADDYAAGLVDPLPGAPGSWTQNESHVYKYDVTLQAAAPSAAQGLTATQAFTWEARSQ